MEASGLDNHGTARIKNTIIANQKLLRFEEPPLDGESCRNSGDLISLGGNLDSDGTCPFEWTADPLLGPLADNGGPTLTHALLPGSPAIDAVAPPDCGYDDDGDPNTPDRPLLTDQRGVSRPQGAGCDIGAYELGVPAISVEIDIEPCSDPNLVNPFSRRLIPVALFGSARHSTYPTWT